MTENRVEMVGECQNFILPKLQRGERTREGAAYTSNTETPGADFRGLAIDELNNVIAEMISY